MMNLLERVEVRGATVARWSLLQRLSVRFRSHILGKGKRIMEKTPIHISTAIALLSLILAPIIGFYTAQASTAAALADVNTKVEVVQARNQDIDARLDRIENKMDKLLIFSGINPSTAGN